MAYIFLFAIIEKYSPQVQTTHSKVTIGAIIRTIQFSLVTLATDEYWQLDHGCTNGRMKT